MKKTRSLHDGGGELGQTANMPSWNDTARKLRDRIDGKLFPNPSAFATQTGMTKSDRATLYKFINGTSKSPYAHNFVDWLDKVGGRIVFPDEEDLVPSKEIQFTAPKIVQAGEGKPPESSDYLAVPLAAGAVAAGRGLVPEDAIRGWILVYRHQDSIRFRSNLIAVEVGKGQDSMTPTIFPGDILLVDRSDFDQGFKHPGNIFLCREPRDNEVMVKRVVLQKANGGTNVMFYSDNSIEYPPQVFNLEEHYESDIGRAIIGRVVWSWSDMSRR